MSLLTDYFAAAASELPDLDLRTGPLGGPIPTAPPKRGRFGRTKEQQPPSSDSTGREFDTVQASGLEPTVVMATLEELLTGKQSMEIIESSDLTPVMEADRQQGPWVFSVRSELRAALASHREDLAPLAQRWAQSEELQGLEPGELESFLAEYTALARRAEERSADLFCWVSL